MVKAIRADLVQGADKEEEDDEEGSTPEEVPEETEDEADSRQQHVLPIADHQPAFEVSASQQDFFKMLDDKIEKGKDYDSSSETEIQREQEHRSMIIERWVSFTQSRQASVSSLTPPSQVKRRLTRSVAKASERHGSPSTSAQCYRRESPPNRRSHSAQTQESRPSTSDWDPNKSPVKRSLSAGSNWKSNSKVAPFPKPKDKKDDAEPSCSKDSQFTYNPTFQNHSPAHTKNQPYIAQISSYPLSQQVTPPSPSKFIAPPAEYQDPGTSERLMTVAQVNTQSQIYYKQGNGNTTPDIVQQRQQTAIHLQQFVAMKQAQQQMFMTYMQRSPHAVLPNVEYQNQPRMDEGEELAAQYGHPGLRPHSAPHRPGFSISDVSHSHMPMWSPLPPVMTTPWVDGQVPPEMQYYPQSQFVPMFRANSAGSAGTLTRYHKKEESEKSVSISVVRGKPVGQIVSVGGQELAVSSAVSDSPSPASISTDSGVSPGTSVPSSKSSFSTTPPTTSANDTFDPKPKKTKVAPVTRAPKLSKSLDA
ncbi:hypothetical protein MSG28_000105 [Choristoneura fumiferana]|uniref:Uncharacterized protein n=1 Tax=Choristoneura fumiferana TaxID=7141 RepID=A0ACC0JZ65_CHOFU|nr:hypothetical protein MSG28_000105 [Choristoneura fumiferana]